MTRVGGAAIAACATITASVLVVALSGAVPAANAMPADSASNATVARPIPLQRTAVVFIAVSVLTRLEIPLQAVSGILPRTRQSDKRIFAWRRRNSAPVR